MIFRYSVYPHIASYFGTEDVMWFYHTTLTQQIVPVADMPNVGYKPKGYQVGAYQPMAFLVGGRKPVIIVE